VRLSLLRGIPTAQKPWLALLHSTAPDTQMTAEISDNRRPPQATLETQLSEPYRRNRHPRTQTRVEILAQDEQPPSPPEDTTGLSIGI